MPAMRFPEFTVVWECKTLDDISKIIDCKHITPQYSEFGIPVVSPGTIRWGEIDLASPTKRVNEDDYKSLMDHCSPQYGDLVFSRNQSVGVACFLLKNEKFVLGQDTVLIQPKNNQSLFTYYLIQNQKVQTSIIKQSGGSTFVRINLKDIRTLGVIVSPSMPEQTKIATFLTAVDDRINQLKQKKTLLEQYKKGVMQKIFDQEIRFKDDDGNEYPDWEIRKLDNVATKKSSNIAANKIEDNYGDYIIYGASGILKRVDFYEEENDYISIIKDGAGVGRIFFCKGKSSVLGTMEIIKPKMQINTYFLYCLLNNIDFVKYVTGSTIPHIYFKDYSIEVCGIPSLPEQNKIANFLSAIDEKISQCNTQIVKTEQYEKGLLQQMFC